MRPSKILAMAAASALAFAPIAAQAAAHSKTVAASKVKRVGPVKKSESKFGGDSTLLLILAVVLIGAGIFVLADNGNDTPTSP
jgi:hypothetical protein